MTKRAWAMLGAFLVALSLAKLLAWTRTRLQSYLLGPAHCPSACEVYTSAYWGESDDSDPKPIKAACSPLTIRLDLKASRVRVGRKPVLWYRAVITNSGCDRLTFVADVFAQGDYTAVEQADGRGIFFAAYSDGRSVPVRPDFAASRKPGNEILLVGGGATRLSPSGDAVTGVSPYIVDHAVEEQRFGDNGGVTLGAGEAIFSQPTIYYPHKEVMKTVRAPGYIATAMGWEQVHTRKPIAPTPPEGFRLLDYLVFRQPGEYDLRLVLDDDVLVQPATRLDALRGWRRRLARAALEVLFLDTWVPSRSVHIRAESNSQRLTVAP